jgi:hypothetical protein
MEVLLHSPMQQLSAVPPLSEGDDDHATGFHYPQDVRRGGERAKKKNKSNRVGGVRFGSFSEGVCAQIMHLGPFSTEGPTIERLHGFIADSGRKPVRKHHEIYLSDIRKAALEKWKTVIRQPMQ